jgi:hypothetical protein
VRAFLSGNNEAKLCRGKNGKSLTVRAVQTVRA